MFSLSQNIMMPGMGKMNPRQVKQAMRKMGIRTEEIPDVEEVIIRKSDKEIVIEKPAVNVMEMQGQKTFQITGESYEIARSNKEMAVDEEDIELVISQTGCSREEAIKALEKCDGQPAEAIIDIMSR
ncbi:MAG: nascent polypeptide-associated complex subunit alpha [Candidatus Methanomethylophilaceae archaeon]|nr:nascent polypeptide-associated complex subunit alpha [Candidatus Methanomethylophilaceae archaeon]